MRYEFIIDTWSESLLDSTSIRSEIVRHSSSEIVRHKLEIFRHKLNRQKIKAISEFKCLAI